MSGILSIVATPIGNLEDITLRAVKTILTSDILVAEDTRTAGKLRQYLVSRLAGPLEVTPAPGQKLIACHEHIEEQTVPLLLHYLDSGKNVALTTDAGTPLISDPGYRLVREALSHGIRVTAVPGANAAIAAVSISGLPCHNFEFHGYLPEKKGKRDSYLARLAKPNGNETTHIIYLSPHKITGTLESIRNIFGDIRVIIIRELTKIHEERISESISVILSKPNRLKGELVLLFNIPQA